MSATGLPPHHEIASLRTIGVHAFVTTRDAGTFGLPEVGEDQAAIERWHSLQRSLVHLGAPRLASSRQVHGTRILSHRGEWEGWMRQDGADGHLMLTGGAAAITVADCVPIFLAHPSGIVAVIHAGWRGVVSGILAQAVNAFTVQGLIAGEIVVHFGPAICGRCYEVGTDVYEKLTGWSTRRPRQVDLRALLAEQAKQLGISQWSASAECTKCDNNDFFSHRAGDGGRQVAVIVAP